MSMPSATPAIPSEFRATSSLMPAAIARLRAFARTAVAADEAGQLRIARGCCATVLRAYWEQAQPGRLPEPPADLMDLDAAQRIAPLLSDLADALGRGGPERAFYELGRLYTALLPPAYRARHGVYYTPPQLAERLLDQVAAAGIDWTTVRVLDPACGGGAFLGPTARRMLTAVRRARPAATPAQLRGQISARLQGFEIDPFGAWIARAAVDAVLWVPDQLQPAGGLAPIVGDALNLPEPDADAGFDLVIGNPPYGRVGLSPTLRQRYRRSLYGHANLYGVFTDLALRHTCAGGIIAYVTPTSFLAGSYFKNLRRLLAEQAPPVSLDFVAARGGVFDDVLQETLLAVYRKDGVRRQAQTTTIAADGNGPLKVDPAGTLTLPASATEPWLAPRNRSQARLLARAQRCAARLVDWGYRVSTGPLVWNRHRAQLTTKPGVDCLPLIWAESIGAEGRFRFRAEKKNHLPYCRVRDRRDHWLVIREPCVLLQRTTAKEQPRRLIAAELPAAFIAEHGGAVVENHLNMIRPLDGVAAVPAAVLAALLNSRVVDDLFRCISGSVAVSAYELSALPLPAADALHHLTERVQAGASRAELDAACACLYGVNEHRANRATPCKQISQRCSNRSYRAHRSVRP